MYSDVIVVMFVTLEGEAYVAHVGMSVECIRPVLAWILLPSPSHYYFFLCFRVR